MDWKATLEEILAERRQQLGTAPNEDELIALRAGELSEEERQRLLDHAAVDPEVARRLFEVLRFPESSPEEDEIEDDNGPSLEQRWQAFQARLADEEEARPAAAAFPPTLPPKPPRLRALPLAATFFLGAAMALLLGPRLVPRVPEPEPRANLSIIELVPVDTIAPGSRGVPETVLLETKAGGLVLTLAVPQLPPDSEDPTYTLELRRGGERVEQVPGLAPGIGNVFVLTLSRASWAPGLHELRLLDPDGREVAVYELDIEVQQGSGLER